MALRKFLYITDTDYHEEAAATDSLELGGLTMGGNIAMGSNKITGLADGVDPSDGVNVSQVPGLIPDATSASGGGTKGKATYDSDFGLLVTAGVAKINLAATNPGLFFDSGALDAKLKGNAGLAKDASGLYVVPNTDAGIGVDGAGVGLVLADTAPGLEFDIEGALKLKIDDTPDTLDLDADGLKVSGLPLQFKINGSAVSASFTQTNADKLVTNADASGLHFHPGAITRLFSAAENVAAGDPVYFSGTANKFGKADTVDAKSGVFAVAQAAILTDAQGPVVGYGLCPGVLSGATPGAWYYLADSGGMSTSLPASGKRVIRIGWAASATDLWVELQDFGKKAS